MNKTGIPEPIRIGDLTRSTGVSDQTVRYYERLGLIRSMGRTQGGFRLFHPDTIIRIQTIKEAQSLGFKLEEIRALLDVVKKDDATCWEAQRLLEVRIQDLEMQIAMLSLHRDILSSIRKDCIHCQGICLIPEHLMDPGKDPEERRKAAGEQ